MALTVFGRSSSANVQKVLWALGELGTGFEQVTVGGRHGGTDTPAFGARNPNRRIPVIEDDGLVLWESHAILRYLAARYGGERFWPAVARERAVIDQWTDWSLSTFQPAWSAVFQTRVRTRADDQDAAAIAGAIERAERLLEILAAQLEATGAFVAGPRLSYADFAIGVAFHRWYTMDIERRHFPAVEAYFERLSQRRAYRDAVCVSYDELRAV